MTAVSWLIIKHQHRSKQTLETTDHVILHGKNTKAVLFAGGLSTMLRAEWSHHASLACAAWGTHVRRSSAGGWWTREAPPPHSKLPQRLKLATALGAEVKITPR